MPSPRRRPKPYVGPDSEELIAYLRVGYPPDHPIDDATYRAAWERHRDTLLAEDRRDRDGRRLVPYAAVLFDGIRGHSSPYCRLGSPLCACRRQS